MTRKMSIGSSEWVATIVDGAGILGIDMSEEQAVAFGVHARELVHWNRKVNLTAITDPFEMAVKHYLDSILAVPLIDSFMKNNPGASLLDVGSGAGFPGIPLKIVLPSLRVSLLEARRKRVNYLKQAIRSLNIDGMHVFHRRLEDMAPESSSEERFDLIICRAFSDLGNFVPSAFPLLSKNGLLLAYKGGHGGKVQAEIDTLRRMKIKRGTASRDQSGMQLHVRVQFFRLPYLERDRTLVVVKAV